MRQGRIVYNYFPIPGREPDSGKIINIYRPFIPIQILAGGKVSRPFYALVDSGSDRNLFPGAIMKILSLTANQGKPKKISGIGNIKITARTFNIEIKLLHSIPLIFETSADFSSKQEIPLLGRDGFFSLFRSIEFRERRKLIELRT